MAGIINVWDEEKQKYVPMPALVGRGIQSFGYDKEQDTWIVVYTDGTSEIIQGPTLESGPTGVLPTVDLVAIDGGTRLVVKDANGTESADILDGHTPVKGTDYFTEADKQELARQAAGLVEKPLIVNPNLLDNWYFVNPVNQRGQTEYARTGYGIDRWRTNFSGDTVVVAKNGVKNTVNSTTGGWHLHQIVDNGVEGLVGQKVTVSGLFAETSNGMLRLLASFRDDSDAEISNIRVDTTAGLVAANGIVPDGTRKIRVGIYAYSGVAVGDSVTVTAVKLEIGDTQTLAHQDVSGNWVLNEIPNYAEELLKCQRHYFAASNYVAWPAYKSSVLYGFITLPTKMRIDSPTITADITVRGALDNEGATSTATVSSAEHGAFGNTIRVALADDGKTNNQVACMITRNLEISAEL